MLRLDKFLSEMGVGTRTEVKKLIKSKQVTVNGEPLSKSEYKVNPDTDQICVDGIEVAYHKYEYYMLNKPAGVVSATSDKIDTTVIDLIKGQKRKDLFPVGRLDKDTEGLLLITNDGDLAHRLLTPGKHVNKTYYAKIDSPVTEEDRDLFAAGLDIGDETPTMPGKLEILRSAEESEILLTIQEGRFHQVKRMFEAVGKHVVYLKRISMGNLKLDETLKEGEYRPLTIKEIETIC